MKKAIVLVAMVSAATLLGGCQQFHSMFAGKPARAETASVDMSSYFAERLETGRRHLLANRPSQAVTAFRQATYDPATAASAYNGMAIAYAQMGRNDLAREYFTAAMQADPTDERYARNLARLDLGGPSAVPERAFAQIDTAAAESIAPSANAAVAPVSAAPPAASGSEAAGLVRVSPREVTLPARANAPTRRPAEVHISARPEGAATARGRVTVESPPASAAYPVRVTLSEVPRTPAPTYPVRIELPRTK